MNKNNPIVISKIPLADAPIGSRFKLVAYNQENLNSNYEKVLIYAVKSVEKHNDHTIGFFNEFALDDEEGLKKDFLELFEYE